MEPSVRPVNPHDNMGAGACIGTSAEDCPTVYELAPQRFHTARAQLRGFQAGSESLQSLRY